MKVSQLIHAMDRDDEIVIDDYDAPVDNMTIYKGAVRGIKKDNPNFGVSSKAERKAVRKNEM